MIGTPERISDDEAEFKNKLFKVRIVCDEICDDNPDNFLFFTQFGGGVTLEKLERDNETDLDLRLICHTIPSKEKKDAIEKQLNDLQLGFPIELFLHSYESYIKGEVGETGTISTVEAMKGNVEPGTVIKLENPSLVSLYTFSTMKMFTNREPSALTKWIKDILDKQNISTDDFELNDFKPENIVNKIELDKEGIVEWIHMYLEHFLHAYNENKDNMDIENLDQYLRRLSKFLLRISFGVAIIDGNYADIKKYYIRAIKTGIHADQVHLDMLTLFPPSWLKNDISDSLRNAIDLRTSGVKASELEDHRARVRKEEHELGIVEGFLSASDFDEVSVSKNSIENLLKLKHKFEATILQITQEVGGVLRRKKFNKAHDFLTELAITNLLELVLKGANELDGSLLAIKTIKEGEEFITVGNPVDGLFVILGQNDGAKETRYKIITNSGETITPEGSKSILGAIGATTHGGKATVSVKASKDLQVIFIGNNLLASILEKKQTISDKTSRVDEGDDEKPKGIDTEESYLRYFLSSYFGTEEASDPDHSKNKDIGILIYSLLNYLSSDFVSHLYERTTAGHSFSNTNDEDSSKSNMLEQYKIEDFSKHLMTVVNKELVKEEYEVMKINDEQVIFDNNVADDGYLYFITDDKDNGGIRIDFNDDGTSTILRKNDFCGESAILPGNKPRNYKATALPGTEVLKIKASDFQTITSSTNLYSVENDAGSYSQITGAELFFHLGAVMLSRLQSLS